MATVIGPTPPGTGVIQPATCVEMREGEERDGKEIREGGREGDDRRGEKGKMKERRERGEREKRERREGRVERD